MNVLSSEYDELESELRGLSAQETARKWNQGLWDTLRKDGRFSAVAGGTGRSDKDTGGEDALSGVALSLRLGVPLLADDRTCQAVVLNHVGEGPGRSFGTDRLISALLNANEIELPRACEATGLLLSWRYRFIVPDRRVLKAVADSYRDAPPGRELRAVAAYVHDSMHDLGLFAGPEPTDPAIPVAIWLFNAWVARAADLVADAWADDAWTHSALGRLTAWVVHEMLPSAPKVLGPQGESAMSVLERQFIGRTLVSLSFIQDTERARSATLSLAQALELPGDRFVKEALQVISGS